MDVYGRRRLVPSWVVAGGALSPHARTHHRLQHPGRWTRLEETTAFARGHGLERGGVRRCVAWDSCGRGMRLFFALLLDGSEEGRLRLGEHPIRVRQRSHRLLLAPPQLAQSLLRVVSERDGRRRRNLRRRRAARRRRGVAPHAIASLDEGGLAGRPAFPRLLPLLHRTAQREEGDATEQRAVNECRDCAADALALLRRRGSPSDRPRRDLLLRPARTAARLDSALVQHRLPCGRRSRLPRNRRRYSPLDGPQSRRGGRPLGCPLGQPRLGRRRGGERLLPRCNRRGGPGDRGPGGGRLLRRPLRRLARPSLARARL
mmetsp:Transcript_28621/g.92086  ORF Transcript_28621/g.92086 Transcript_28621/m.92086 type:complete len:317 (+) Transcript_28621:180-1130(+)